MRMPAWFIPLLTIGFLGVFGSACSSLLESDSGGLKCKVDLDCDNDKICKAGWCVVPELVEDTCGNTTIDLGETCDGNCPETCSDGNACWAVLSNDQIGTLTARFEESLEAWVSGHPS